MKKIIRNRTRDSIQYTFHSYGVHHSFYPNRIINDDRIVNEANMFESMTMLDFYKAEVRNANLPHVYILDNKGNNVSA